jgi:hypothetical protein
MTSWYRRASKRGPWSFADDVERRLFPWVPTASCKVQCAVCGRRGYPGGAWQNPHRKGHAPCPDCGKQLTLLANGTPRFHTRCPRRSV